MSGYNWRKATVAKYDTPWTTNWKNVEGNRHGLLILGTILAKGCKASWPLELYLNLGTPKCRK